MLREELWGTKVGQTPSLSLTPQAPALAARPAPPYSFGLMDPHAYRHRHLLGIEGLTPEDITYVLDVAEGYVDMNREAEKKKTTLRGRTLINCFFENSTRTRTSFEVAGKRLGADVINMAVAVSSMRKGETLIDTAMTLNAMHPDVLVVRHPESGAVQLLVGKGRLRRHQRRRRQPRAPDPGAARRADDPPPQGQAGRAHRRDLRRRAAQPGRALEHRAAQRDGRAGARRGAAHAAAGRRSNVSASRCFTTWPRASPTSTS